MKIKLILVVIYFGLSNCSYSLNYKMNKQIKNQRVNSYIQKKTPK